MDFKQTGKQIEVTVPELTEYVIKQLDLYDKYGDKNDGCPYTDPIIYTTKDGKTIMVPKDIQKSIVDTRKPIETFQEMKPVKKIEKNIEKTKESSDWKLYVFIIIGFIVCYLLYKSYKN